MDRGAQGLQSIMQEFGMTEQLTHTHIAKNMKMIHLMNYESS